MKEVDPTMKIFFNFNGLQPKSLKKFLRLVGKDLVDGAEFHGKWPFGGNPNLPPGNGTEVVNVHNRFSSFVVTSN